MKLSEALRKGAEGQAQWRGDYFLGPEEPYCCALGAIMLAVDPDARIKMWRSENRPALSADILRAGFPERYATQLDDTGLEVDLTGIFTEIVKRNDDFENRWSFEDIATWLEEQGE